MSIYMFDLKEFRRINKLTQSETGAYFGVEQSFISQIEKGKRPLPNEFISKIEADDKYIIPSIKEVIDNFVSRDVISMPADVWAVISNQAKSLEVKDRQTSEAMKQTSEVIELLKEQLKKGGNAEKPFRAASVVVVEDE